MKTLFLVIGIFLIIVGASSTILLSVYSLFTSIPIIILGFCVIGFGFTRVCISKVAIVSSTIIVAYCLISYALMVQSQALT